MRTPTPEDFKGMLAQVSYRAPFGGRDRALLILAANTGLRVSELIGLDVHHVADARGIARDILQLPASLAAKGGSERIIPLNKRARMAVVELLQFNKMRGFSVALEAPLFVNRKHQRLSVRAVQYVVANLRKKAELDVQVTPHSLRHYCGSQLVRETGNIRICQKILGHVRLNTSALYAHPGRDEMAAAMECIG